MKRKELMEDEFVKINNERFGYNQFDFIHWRYNDYNFFGQQIRITHDTKTIENLKIRSVHSDSEILIDCLGMSARTDSIPISLGTITAAPSVSRLEISVGGGETTYRIEIR